jgi:hypothetical protein
VIVEIFESSNKLFVNKRDTGLSVSSPEVRLISTIEQGPRGPIGPVGPQGVPGDQAPPEDGTINYDVNGLIVSIVTPSKTTSFLRNANNDIIGADYGSYSKMFFRNSEGTITGWEIVYA